MAVTKLKSKQQFDITDNLDFKSTFRGINVVDPTAPQDIATKAYVDATVQGLRIKDACRVATTANITLSGTQTIDGVAMSAGDRVLAKNQTTGSQNGIYVVAAGAWSRAADANTSAELGPGLFTFISEGTTNGNTGWVMTTDAPVTMDTTALVFSQFSGAGTYVAGNGLTLTGNSFSVVGTANRITVTGSGVDIASTYVGQTSITTLGPVTSGQWQATVVGVQYGGTGANLAATGGAGQVVKQTTVGGAFTVGTLAAGDISGGAALTKTDDTNVTLTLGGTPGSALLVATSLTLGWTGTLSVARGGTGTNTHTANGILYGNGTGAILATAQGAANTVLTGTGAAPAFSGTPTVTTITTIGQIGHAVNPYGTSAGNTGELRFYELAANGTDYVGFKAPDAIGTGLNLVFTLPATDASGNTKYLASNGSKALSFVQIASTEINNTTFVTSITGTANRITIGGTTTAPTVDISTAYVGQGTITTLGAITTGSWTATTIAVAYGGTGQTTYTNGQLLIGNSTGNTLTKATLTQGTGITITNGAGAITIAIASTVLQTTNFVTRETPTGTVDGTNATFTLANTPVAGTEHVFVNGILMNPGAGNDYTISTTTITFLSGAIPQTNDVVRVSYIKS